MITKGKWYFNKAAAEKGTARVCGEFGMIAECGPKHQATKEHFDNAKLIAATPELLEACEEFDKSFFKEGQINIGKINKARIKAQIAIKKAKKLRRKIQGADAIANAEKE